MSDARGPLRFRGTLVLRDSALSYRLRRGLNLVSTESGQLRLPPSNGSLVRPTQAWARESCKDPGEIRTTPS